MSYTWSYVLNRGISLTEDEHGGMLLSENPLAAFRLNNTAFQLLKDCDANLRLDEIFAKHRRLSVESALRFFESFEKKGVLRRVYQRSGGDGEYPSVSVVIPVRNRPQEIKSCLESILACDYPSDRLEIIVVDDFSTDGETQEVIRQYPVTMIAMPENVGQSKCRNMGAARASGDIIAFTDSDCVVDRNWLVVLIEPFVTAKVGVVGGGVDSYGRDNALDMYEAVRSPLHMGDSSAEIAPTSAVPYVPTCNVLIRKEAFIRVNGFSEEMHFGEDVDLIWRVLQEGYRGWYLPEGRILHRHRNRFLPFLKRRAEYASSEATLEKRFSFNRKKVYLSYWNMLNIGIVVLFLIGLAGFHKIAPVTVTMAVLGGLAISFSAELLVKKTKLDKINFHTPFRQLVKALGRSHLAFLGHFTAVLSRYYAIPLLIAAFFVPACGLFLAATFLLSAYFDFVVKKPHLNYLSYTVIYILEMLAYQIGVIYGCLKERNYSPIFHKIKII